MAKSTKSKRGHGWWWLLLVIILAGLGYYLYSEIVSEPVKDSVIERPAPVKKLPLPPEPQGVTGEEGPIPVRPTPDEPLVKPVPKEDYCARIEKNVTEFFRYLDEKAYIKKLNPKTDAYTRFKNILRRAAARPPLPAGEGADPKMIIRNLYHFFRILDIKDLSLIRDVLKNEQDTMEISLEMFYRWLTLGDRCPDPENIRPSMKVLYQYAGFFVNTTGGRAYLFRRPSGLRLLVSYYCILVVHEADKKGRNSCGIDIFPLIEPLKNEIGYYPDFQFQEEYISQLGRLEDYYKTKR
ncbi:MAG: hypothetical protein JRJ21_01350 [Deltaproteobacteria bacterium]|nr:hypothetical protein [Deltaproteobacteria bacterium]